MILRRIRERDQPVVPSGFNLSVNARGHSGGARLRDAQSIGGLLAGAPFRQAGQKNFAFFAVVSTFVFAILETGLYIIENHDILL